MQKMIHRGKYKDAEAVAAVATADDYVKNTGDEITGTLTFKDVVLQSHAADYFYILKCSENTKGRRIAFGTSGTCGPQIIGFPESHGSRAGEITFEFGSTHFLLGTAKYNIYAIAPAGSGGTRRVWCFERNVNRCYNDLDMQSKIIKDPKNHVASALSGTKKLVEIDIGGVPYYFEVYPTKA